MEGIAYGRGGIHTLKIYVLTLALFLLVIKVYEWSTVVVVFIVFVTL